MHRHLLLPAGCWRLARKFSPFWRRNGNGQRVSVCVCAILAFWGASLRKVESQPFAFPSFGDWRMRWPQFFVSCESAASPVGASELFCLCFCTFDFCLCLCSWGSFGRFYLFRCTIRILYWQKDVWLGDSLLALSPQQQHPPKGTLWPPYHFSGWNFVFFFLLVFPPMAVCWLRFYSLVHFKFIDFQCHRMV